MSQRLWVKDAEIQYFNNHIKILQGLLRDSQQKGINVNQENTRLNDMLKSYANNMEVQLIDIEKTIECL
jgi:hypothetical protein